MLIGDHDKEPLTVSRNSRSSSCSCSSDFSAWPQSYHLEQVCRCASLGNATKSKQWHSGTVAHLSSTEEWTQWHTRILHMNKQNCTPEFQLEGGSIKVCEAEGVRNGSPDPEGGALGCSPFKQHFWLCLQQQRADEALLLMPICDAYPCCLNASTT